MKRFFERFGFSLTVYQFSVLYCGGGFEDFRVGKGKVRTAIEKLINCFDDDIDGEHYQCSVENSDELAVTLYPAGLLVLDSLKNFDPDGTRYFLASSREEVIDLLCQHAMGLLDYKQFRSEKPKLPPSELFGGE